MKPKRPALRWHGGKWKLADWIISHFPQHRVYVEPFGGAASVLLKKQRSYSEVYNDLDGEVANYFRVLRDNGDELRRQIQLTPFAREEFQLSYEPAEDPIEQARRTAIRCFMGFGSDGHGKVTGFRANSNRSNTTPAHDWMNYPGAMHFLTERLQGVVIETRDAIEVMAQQDSPTTLHYVDPPYVHSTRGGRVSYKHEMSDEEHSKLAQFLSQLEGTVILSGYDSEMYQDLYRNWTCYTKETHADGARPRTEFLWISPDSPQAVMNF